MYKLTISPNIKYKKVQNNINIIINKKWEMSNQAKAEIINS